MSSESLYKTQLGADFTPRVVTKKHKVHMYGAGCLNKAVITRNIKEVTCRKCLQSFGAREYFKKNEYGKTPAK